MNDFLRTPRRAARGTGTALGETAIGIDLGGTNLRAALYSSLGEAPECIIESSVPVGEDRDPDGVVATLGSIIRELREHSGDPTAPVGVGFAGMLEGDSGFVVNSPHMGWRDVPFGTLLREELGDQRVGVWNDVNAITYGEFRVGAGVGASDVLAVFVGTGVGGGMITDGRLVMGSSGCAAEIGHTKVALDESAVVCACGLRGCIEAYVGGHYLKRRARAELRGGARSLAVSIAGGVEKVNPSHLDLAAARGDDYSLDLFTELAPLLGAVLANAVTLLNPSHLILGGGVLSRMPVLCDHVVAALEVAVNPPAAAQLVVTQAMLGDSAGTIGSALLAYERYER